MIFIDIWNHDKEIQHKLRGEVAQLGEHSVRNAAVEGSSPFFSTILFHQAGQPV